MSKVVAILAIVTFMVCLCVGVVGSSIGFPVSLLGAALIGMFLSFTVAMSTL